MEIRLRDHQDADVIGDKKQILKIITLMKNHLISILNLKEIQLDLVTMHPFKKVKVVLNFLKGNKKIIILILIRKWMIL